MPVLDAEAEVPLDPALRRVEARVKRLLLIGGLTLAVGLAAVATTLAAAIAVGSDDPFARYEAAHSPLDLGAEPARVAPGTRVSYLPAAVMVCRVDVIHALNGFDPELRTGEDVDLVWRAVAAGHRVRYEPESVVHHHPRDSVRAACRLSVRYQRGQGDV